MREGSVARVGLLVVRMTQGAPGQETEAEAIEGPVADLG